jgi:hypothetical protein
MAYQVKTTRNYGQRLTGSLQGIVGGFIIFIVGTVLLFLNEGNYVKQDKAIREAAKTLVRVSDVSSVDTALEGKLIHACAFADTQDTLEDGQFGVKEQAIALSRTVEYYQYVEHESKQRKDKLGGGEETITTYTYDKKWVTTPVNSAGFADPDFQKKNFVLDNEIKAQTQYAKNVTFGAYKLPAFIVRSIEGGDPADINLSKNELAQWNSRIDKRMTELKLKAEDRAMLASVQDNVMYLGVSSSPQIGDMRITLTKIQPADISIIARVVGTTFEEYTASNGRTFSSIAMGTVSADSMIASEKRGNSALTWALRLIGLILVCAGIYSIFNIIPTLFKVLPPLASIVGAGVGLVCFIGGLAWSLVVVSIAWLFYRPLIGVPLLAAAIAGIWFLGKRAKEKKAAKAGATTNASAPVPDGWTCACGVVNKGKFCADCGKPKPAGVPQYKCDKCGWQPPDMAHLPKFCPDCGDPFDDGDIVRD